MSKTSANLTLKVADLDRSLTFYQALGFTLDQRWVEHYAQLSMPGMQLGLHPSTGQEPTALSDQLSIGLKVADIAAAEKQLAALGIEFENRQEAGGAFLHFRDPDGVALYFIQPRS